jgi:hypothetical protein
LRSRFGTSRQALRRDQSRRLECLDIAEAGLNVFSSTAAMFSLLLKQVFHALNEARGPLET